MLIKMQSLDRIMRLDPMPRGDVAEPRRGRSFVSHESTMTISRGYKVVMKLVRNDVIGSHKYFRIVFLESAD